MVYAIPTFIVSMIIVWVSVYAPTLPEKLVDLHPLKCTFGIITSALAFILIIAGMMYKCRVWIHSDEEITQEHGYIQNMLMDTVLEDETTSEDEELDALIQFILD